MVSLIRIRFEVWDSPIGSLTDYKADEFDELPELFTSVIVHQAVVRLAPDVGKRVGERGVFDLECS